MYILSVTGKKAWSKRGISVAYITSEMSKRTKDDVISGVYQLGVFLLQSCKTKMV